MFELAALPPITFVAANSEQTLVLSDCGRQIDKIAGAVADQAPAGSTVGLVFRSSPELVLHWLAVLAAGRVPLILQYPTEKLSRAFWHESLLDSIKRCNLCALLCDPAVQVGGGDKTASSELSLDICQPGAPEANVIFPGEGEIVQLSSGTTGFKKPVRFDFHALRTHVRLFNEGLQLGPDDRIVSWLPLSHDMGLIACFVMPLMLGIPITMIDPIDWVHQPQLLFSAIRKHRGTVCYMPNFGFEVMAKAGKQKPMPAMRHWISCSEPTYPATLERFMQATDADPSQLSTCYGMAENVFAVTKSAGLRIFEHDERRYVSCGRPIAGTEIKLVDDELFVRSPHSIKAYEGGENIRDAEGYYATGDLGFLVDGEVVITGRKQDLANVGGQKYLLNDLDFALGQIFPESAGRIASIALHDAACGTEKVLFLIENDRFWEKQRSEEPAQLIREATGVEWIEVHFVPRRFITKTSSGKINRNKTLEAWQACQSFDGIGAAPKGGEVDLAKQLRDRVPGVAADRPVGEALDSLGLVMLRLFCEEHGIDYAPDLTLACIASSGQSKDETAKPRVFSIVAMVDGIRLGIRSAEPRIDEAFLDSIAKAVGMPVHLEHLCAPPIPILFSDLIFHDYFLPRNSGPEYAPFSSEIKKIKNADLLLVDDEDPFRMPCYSAYPVLDRNFETDPEAALLGHRLQRYTQNHHLLPRRVMLGREITPETINPALKSMESYLGKPIFKMAFHDTARKYTADWDFCEHLPISDEERLTNTTWVGRFQQTLLEFIGRRFTRADSYRPGENRSILHQHPHFCSILMNRAAVDFITDRYQSFCIIGLPSSLPYLQHRLEALGKPYVHTLQADNMHRDFDCIVITGGNGNISSTCKPVFDFMHAQRGGGRPNNVSRELEQLCPSLAACNQQLYRRARDQYGTDSPLLIGNYLLNQSIALVLPSLALQEQIAVPLALGS